MMNNEFNPPFAWVIEGGRHVYETPMSNTRGGDQWGEVEQDANFEWRWFWMDTDGTVVREGVELTMAEAKRRVELVSPAV